MAIRRTLNAQYCWSKAASVARLQLSSEALPASLLCPLCNKPRGWLYLDPTFGGPWYHCRACQANCDLLEMLGGIWKTDIPGVVQRLRAHGIHVNGTEESTQRYIREYVDRRRSIEQQWKTWSSRAWWLDSPSRTVLSRMQVRLDLSSPRWREGPAPWCAVAAYEELQQVWSVPRSGERGRAPMMVIPFRDVPNRIVSAALVGGDYANTIAHRSWLLKSRADREFGIAYHPSMLEHAGPVLALRDLRCIVWLCLKHIAHAVNWLPVVAWHAGPEGRTGSVWGGWPHWSPVFWEDMMSVDLLDQAIRAQGRIHVSGLMHGTVTGTQATAILKRLTHWKHPPMQIIQEVFRTAKPWQEVAGVWIESLSDDDCVATLAQLQQLGHDLDQLAGQLPSGAQNRVRRFLATHVVGRTTRFGRLQVVEKETGWFHVTGRDESLIADAVLRIDRAVYYRQSDCIHYEGRILYRGQEVPFTVPQETLEDQGFHWMRGEIIRTGLGVIRYHPDWRRHAVPLALQFHRPEIVNGLDAIGWNVQDQCVQLPRYSLGKEGRVLAPSSQQTYADLPGWTIPLPAPVETVDWLALDVGSPAAPLLWGTVAALISMIIAPPGRARPSGLILSGHGARVVGGQVCDALGVPRLTVGQKIPPTNPHFWPRWIDLGRTPASGKIAEWLLESPFWHVVPLGWHQAVSLAWHGGWHLLEGRAPVCLPGRACAVLPTLLACYLERVARARWILPAKGISLADDVICDLAAWFREIGAPLHPGESRGALHQDAPLSRASLLVRVLEEIHFERAHREPVLSISEGYVKARKSCLALWHQPFAPAWQALGDDLRACQALRKEECQFWYIDARWWADVSPRPARIERLIDTARKEVSSS